MIFRIVLIISITIVLIGLFGFFYFYITDFNPQQTISIESSCNNQMNLTNDTISILIWNIGYCGLGREMDFFYDGGEQVRAKKNLFENYTHGILNFLRDYNNNTDFILLQEVDRNSKRSYYSDQFQLISNIFENYCGYFADNYKCSFVPIPLKNPLGKIHSGICIFSKYKAISSIRYPFENKASIPKKFFVLDRCCIINRYRLHENKELIIVNIHNSAYDNGEEKTEQVNFLAKFIKEEISKQNYVIIGGDWNQIPPDFDNNKFSNNQKTEWYLNLKPIDKSIFPNNVKFIYDEHAPTNRSLDKPYVSKHNFETIIDFFLISANFEVLSIKTFNEMNFSFSDHNPVLLKLLIKK